MSAILSADNLSDFITPSVACIKPVETLPANASGENNELEINFNSGSKPTTAPPAEISLTDCLACSGCVTSAEAVLVSMQSHAEVLSELDSGPALRLRGNTAGTGIGIENMDQGGRIYVASVSPQSRASIAATFEVTEQEAGYMIEQLLSGPKGIKNRAVYRNGFQWVLDTNIAREACLVLGAEEVVGSMVTGKGETKQPVKPILTSSCPGWICYAEKTHPHILPHLSRLKSPQALMGTLLKTILSRKLGISPDRIWHVAIMPCFDKKLEASREELTHAAWEGTGARGVRDVDCVITSKELLMLAESRRVDFAKLPRTPLPYMPFPERKLNSFLFPSSRRRRNNVPAAGTSGGNLYYILQYYASKHQGATVETARGRNADVLEYTVTSATGETLLKAARYYGFRNIQNLVRRLKPARPSRMPGGKPIGSARKAGGKPTGPDYAYVEVMACPGGCTNGGGQIKVDDPVITGQVMGEAKPGPQEQKRWLARVDEAYFSGEDSAEDEISDSRDDVVDGISPSYIKDTLAQWATTTGLDLDRLVYTSYREVVSNVGKNVGETERVIQIASKEGGGW
ncbi:cytosolic Fe-S cluster assembly factor NAR1 [Acephala macrosclerotiorum]|nr:cytosolic Fe-S cluster assembly factor NAR1 [Acephala macrosclerotiorum]